MGGALLGVLVFVLVASTGLAAAGMLRMDSLAKMLLAAYVIAFGEIVALVLLLSAFRAVRRPELLIALVVLCVVAVGVWLRRNRPLPPASDAEWRSAAFLRRNPAIGLLALVVGAALAYVVALILGTPPNNWDSLTYHLARAAFWRQNGGVEYIADSYDERLNANPPNAELALTFVLELTRNERLAGFVQFFALIACAGGIVALSRRVGLTRREAMFGALLFVLLPVIVLQGSTSQNDLVVASLLIAATVFVVGSSRQELGLASLALALAVGTKIPAALAVPVLCAVALVTPPTTSRLGRLVALGVGVVVGSYWYLVNVLETGRLLGRRPDTELIALLDLKQNLLSAYARVLEAFDLPGAEGTKVFVLSGLNDADVLLYVIVAAALTAGLILASLLTRRVRVRDALVAGGLSLLPLAVAPASYVLWRGFAKLHDVLHEPARTLPVGDWSVQTTASDSFSWFGPLGLLLVIGMGAAVVALVRRRSLPPLALVLAVAPLAWLVLLSLAVGYDPWQGRFFMFPVALSASLWGILLRRPPFAWAAVGVGAVTVALSFVHSLEKPSGLSLFADRESVSVWGMERWRVQSVDRSEMTPVLQFLDERVPGDATIALAFGEDDFGYPAFGQDLERRVVLVPEGSNGRAVEGAGWLVTNPQRARVISPVCWRIVLAAPGGWRVFERTVARCPG